MNYFIYDISEITLNTNSSKCELILFGINKTANKVAIRICDAPFFLFLQVPITFNNIIDVQTYINTNVRINNYSCNRTHCCGKKSVLVSTEGQGEEDSEEEEEEEGEETKENKGEEKETFDYLNTCPCVNNFKNDRALTKIVDKIEVVSDYKTNICYTDQPQKFLKIYLTRPSFVTNVKSVLYRYVKDAGLGGEMEVHEAYNNVSKYYSYSFDKSSSIASNIVSLKNMTLVNSGNKKTTIENEYLCSYDKLEIIKDDKEFFIPPLNKLSIDIEVEVHKKGVFCVAEKNPILCISVYEGKNGRIFGYGLGKSRFCETLYRDEKEMLERFLQYVKYYDIFLGYNSNSFDWPYIFDRAELLNVPNQLSSIIDYKSIVLKTTRKSKQLAEQNVTFFNIPGKIFVDVMSIIQKDGITRASYTLQNICIAELNRSKLDIEVEKCSIMVKNGGEEREKVYEYCIEDSILVWLLEEKKQILNDLFVQCNLYGMFISNRLTDGMQLRLTQLGRQTTRHEKILLSSHNRGVVPVYNEILPKLDVNLKGATVMEPKVGYYNIPIIVLDFSSLYPSIMRAHNLCPTTLCKNETEAIKHGAVKMPTGYWFVPASVCKGVLPLMCEDLLNKRNYYKKKHNEEKDDMQLKKIYDLRQNSYKVANNSIYGGTNAAGSSFYCPFVAATVTAFGRQSFEIIKTIITDIKGLEPIYGDTDSIFIAVHIKTTLKDEIVDENEAKEMDFNSIEEFSSKTKIQWSKLFLLGDLIVDRINNSGFFKKEQRIAKEKIVCPFLLITAKQYAGNKYETEKDEGKIFEKGTVGVKKGTAPIVSKFYSKLIKNLLLRKFNNNTDIELYVRNEIYNIWTGKDITISDFVISMKLNQQVKYYKNKDSLHLNALKYWDEFKPNDSIEVGNKIPFIIVKLPGANKDFERSRPPFMVNSLSEIDIEYYINHYLCKPLTNIMNVLKFKPLQIRSIFNFNLNVIVNRQLPSIIISEEYLSVFAEEETNKKQKITENNEIKPILKKQKTITNYFKKQ
jgi:DNA polymerase delta subunit 1